MSKDHQPFWDRGGLNYTRPRCHQCGMCRNGAITRKALEASKQEIEAALLAAEAATWLPESLVVASVFLPDPARRHVRRVQKLMGIKAVPEPATQGV